MEKKYNTTTYKKNIHHVQFRHNNIIQYKFIVKTFRIYISYKNTVAQWKETFIFVTIIEKNMYICILSDITFTFYLSTCKSYTMSVKSICK